MTSKHKSISIRQCLQRLDLASEDDLRSRVLEVPAFLNAWAEFRDDFLWGSPEGLSGHVFLKVVVPATLRELSDPNPTSFYIYRTVSGPASYATPFAKVDKTHFTLSDHYVRLLLQTLPSLSRAPDGIFLGKMGTDAGREACVEALAFTIHALRNQYRPKKEGNMSRWLEKNVPDSRHAEKAKGFDNPRYSAMRAQTVDVSEQEEDLDGGAAAAKEGGEKIHGISDSAALREEVGHGVRLNGQSLSNTSKSSASNTPTPPSLSAINKATTPTIMGISNRSLKRNHSATSPTAAHNSPNPKVARTGLSAATTTNDKAGALNVEVKQEPDTPTEQNAIIPFTSLSLSSENDVKDGMDQANMMQEGNEQNMSPHTLILLEQVRVARRGYAKAEAELAIEDNIIAHAGAAAMVEAGQAGWRDWVAKKAEMEVWRKRCENSLRELRGVADVNELESVWAGLEAAKRL
ncbi:hypothetical protein BFW01_g11884 [Lasiodiplodia theobromae]|nr:hypothetical protein BFW01_g11884 [Lasiodiplodia theobromae]